MTTNEIVAALDEEIKLLERAKALLSEGEPAKRQPGRPKGSTSKQTSPAEIAAKPRPTMSASSRERIAAAQRARWARQKGRAAPKEAAPVKKTGAKQSAKIEKRPIPAKKVAKPAKPSPKKISAKPQTTAETAATA